MVFKRRDKKPFWRSIGELFYPRGGWGRAIQYVRHRLQRLPDPPHRIARGIFIGVLTSFTPLFGFHFVVAILFGKLMRANIIAAVLATFFGNPITFPFIAGGSLSLGHRILGSAYDGVSDQSLMGSFAGAWRDLRHNFNAIFTDKVANWSELHGFYTEVFLPYLTGGLLLGTIAGLIAYFLSAPIISAYQKSRKKRLQKKLAKLRKKAAKKKADEAAKLD